MIRKGSSFLSVGGLLFVFLVDRWFKVRFLAKSTFNQGVGFGFPLLLPLLGLWLLWFGLLVRAIVTKRSGLLMLVSGGLSNLIDRLKYGQVIDYFNSPYLSFNLADVLISGGIIWLIYRMFTKK